jgi:hypothetical protein
MDMIGAIMAVLCIFLGMYGLYFVGLIPFASKRALMFVGSMNGKGASFEACSGYVKRIVRFKNDGRCVMRLLTVLTKGEVCAELLDRAGNRLAYLDGQHGEASFSVKGGERYRLTVRFRSASGKYELEWNEE